MQTCEDKWLPAETMPEDENLNILVACSRGVFSCSVRFARQLSRPATHWMPLPEPPQLVREGDEASD